MQPGHNIQQIPSRMLQLLRSYRFMMIQFPDCDVWASRTQRKIFSFEWLSERNMNELQRELMAPTNPSAWRIYGPESGMLAMRVEQIVG